MGLTTGLLQGLNKLTYAKYLDECLSHSEHYRLAIVIVIMDWGGGRSAARNNDPGCQGRTSDFATR